MIPKLGDMNFLILGGLHSLSMRASPQCVKCCQRCAITCQRGGTQSRAELVQNRLSQPASK